MPHDLGRCHCLQRRCSILYVEDIGLPTLRTTESIGYDTLTRFGKNKAVPTVATTITGGARKNREG